MLYSDSEEGKLAADFQVSVGDIQGKRYKLWAKRDSGRRGVCENSKRCDCV